VNIAKLPRAEQVSGEMWLIPSQPAITVLLCQMNGDSLIVVQVSRWQLTASCKVVHCRGCESARWPLALGSLKGEQFGPEPASSDGCTL
jgi:hypothetical protein